MQRALHIWIRNLDEYGKGQCERNSRMLSGSFCWGDDNDNDNSETTIDTGDEKTSPSPRPTQPESDSNPAEQPADMDDHNAVFRGSNYTTATESGMSMYVMPEARTRTRGDLVWK